MGWLNAKRKPFDDPRVRRAMHLLLDKQVLVDVVKDVSPLMTGGFIYPFSEFATPKDQLAKRFGYQDDPGPAISAVTAGKLNPKTSAVGSMASASNAANLPAGGILNMEKLIS